MYVEQYAHASDQRDIPLHALPIQSQGIWEVNFLSTWMSFWRLLNERKERAADLYVPYLIYFSQPKQYWHFDTTTGGNRRGFRLPIKRLSASCEGWMIYSCCLLTFTSIKDYNPISYAHTIISVLVSLGKVFKELFQVMENSWTIINEITCCGNITNVALVYSPVQVAGNMIAEVLFLFGPSRLAYRQLNTMKCNKLFWPNQPILCSIFTPVMVSFDTIQGIPFYITSTIWTSALLRWHGIIPDLLRVLVLN